jgi:hypothetical protein
MHLGAYRKPVHGRVSSRTTPCAVRPRSKTESDEFQRACARNRHGPEFAHPTRDGYAQARRAEPARRGRGTKRPCRRSSQPSPHGEATRILAPFSCLWSFQVQNALLDSHGRAPNSPAPWRGRRDGDAFALRSLRAVLASAPRAPWWLKQAALGLATCPFRPPYFHLDDTRRAIAETGGIAFERPRNDDSMSQTTTMPEADAAFRAPQRTPEGARP